MPQVIVAEPTKLIVFILRSRKTTRAFLSTYKRQFCSDTLIFLNRKTRAKNACYFSRAVINFTHTLHAVFIFRFNTYFFIIIINFSYTICHCIHQSNSFTAASGAACYHLCDYHEHLCASFHDLHYSSPRLLL